MELNSELERLQKYAPIDAELKRAEAKHPAWPPNIFEQVAIINEEAGEVTKSVLHYKREGGSLDDVKKELIQTAAMCMRMLNALKDCKHNGRRRSDPLGGFFCVECGEFVNKNEVKHS